MTRGWGLLEFYLCRKRAEKVDCYVPDRLRGGTLFDLGCGSYAHFLHHTKFREKWGAEPRFDFNLHIGRTWPEAADCVTLLASIEHMADGELCGTLTCIENILRPGGVLIITTPSKWTGWLMRFLAWLHLLSPVEIGDHKRLYSRSDLCKILAGYGFTLAEYSTFEFGLNQLFVFNARPNFPGGGA